MSEQKSAVWGLAQKRQRKPQRIRNLDDLKTFLGLTGYPKPLRGDRVSDEEKEKNRQVHILDREYRIFEQRGFTKQGRLVNAARAAVGELPPDLRKALGIKNGDDVAV